MKLPGHKMTLLWLSVALGASLVAFSPARASCVSNFQQPAEGQQSAADQEPVSSLRLTPEQREQIRSIREQSKDERFSANRHLRQAQLALEQSLDFDDPGQAVIDQRIRDVAEAQAALMRIRVRTELKIRRVLTPEQLSTFHQLQQRARDLRRERRL